MMAFAMTNVGKSTFIQRYTGKSTIVIKRPLHVLNNGNLAVVIFDDNATTSPYGNKNDQPTVSLWESNADRTTFTKKVTHTLPAGTFPANSGMIHAGAVRNPVDDSIFVVWRGVISNSTPGYAVYGSMFPRSGSTWTAPGGSDLIYTPAAAGRWPFRFDLDINPVNQRIMISWMFHGVTSTTNTTGTYFAIRTGANAYTVLQGDVGLGSTGNVHSLTSSEDISIAIDPMSDSTYTRVNYIVNAVMTNKDYGDYIGYKVIRNSDNVIVGSGFIKSGLNASRGDGRRTNYMFSTGNGEFAVIGMGGTTSGEGYALKYKTTSAVNSTAPAYTASAPITYTPSKVKMDRTGSPHCDVSVAYANGNFTVLYHDTAFRNLVGKFSGSKVTWEATAYGWDVLGDITAFVTDPWRFLRRSSVYGGARSAGPSNKLDSLMQYFDRDSISSANAWAHQYNRPWRAPESVLPGPGTTVSTSVPTLGIYADIDQSEPRSALVARWQIAKDVGFSTSLKTYDSPNPAYVKGTHITGSYKYIAEKLPLSLALATGSWYIRAAQVDSFGTVGTYSAGKLFTVSHTPWGTELSPSGSSIFAYGVGNVTFSWKFNDPYENDSQSAYRILVTNTSDDSVVLDTSKISGSDPFATLTIPSSAKNSMLAWQVQLWDIDGAAGLLSSPALFEVADPPIPNITFPTDGMVIDNARPAVSWSTDDTTGTGQVAYRVYFLNNGVQVFDSGWINGSDQAYTPPDIILRNLQSYSMIVAVRNGIGLENQSSVSFTTSWAVPASPSLNGMSVDFSHYGELDKGYIVVHWNYQNTDSEFLSWRLYRRYHLPSSAMVYDKGLDWELVYEEFAVSPPDGSDVYTYLDYTAPSGYQVHYIITQTALRFGSIVESTPPALSTLGVYAQVYSPNYWLITMDPTGQPEGVLRLEQATADSYTEEYETEEFHVVGRGRHIEVGDRLGYSGQLAIPLRFIEGSGNSDDPRRLKLDLENFRALRRECWIRTPFGDLFKASTGDMQFERIAGVGSSEFTDVTLPYREVYDSGS